MAKREGKELPTGPTESASGAHSQRDGHLIYRSADTTIFLGFF